MGRSLRQGEPPFDDYGVLGATPALERTYDSLLDRVQRQLHHRPMRRCQLVIQHPCHIQGRAWKEQRVLEERVARNHQQKMETRIGPKATRTIALSHDAVRSGTLASLKT